MLIVGGLPESENAGSLTLQEEFGDTVLALAGATYDEAVKLEIGLVSLFTCVTNVGLSTSVV